MAGINKKKVIKSAVILTALLAVVVILSGCAEKGPETAEKTSQAVKFYTITTATPCGTYYPVGVSLATLWTEKLKDKGIRISAQSSAGSVENINILRNKEAEFAILQGLIGFNGLEGRGAV